MTKLNLLRWIATLVLACVALTACRTSQQEPIIAEPGPPPLPPASGTPVGILIDEASKLALRADQMDRLREIDQQLATRNDHIDSQLRDMERPPERGPGGPHGGKGRPPGGGGMGGGGMGGGGMGGGGMGGGGMGGGGMGEPPNGGRSGGPRGQRPPPGMPPRDHSDPDVRSRLLEEKAANVKDAITRALESLDPDQRELAQQLLDDRGANDAPEKEGPPGFGSDRPSRPPK